MRNFDGKFLGFLFFMSLSAVGLANIAFWALKGDLLLTFISVFAGWTSYLLAHYMSQGGLIDGGLNDRSGAVTPEDKKEVAGVVLGTVILVSGMGIGVYALKDSNLILTMGAAILFHTGYVVAHHAVTQELV